MEITQLRLECLRMASNLSLDCQYCLLDVAEMLMTWVLTGEIDFEDEDDEPKESCALNN